MRWAAAGGNNRSGHAAFTGLTRMMTGWHSLSLCKLFPFREFPQISRTGEERIMDRPSSRTAGTHPTQSQHRSHRTDGADVTRAADYCRAN